MSGRGCGGDSLAATGSGASTRSGATWLISSVSSSVLAVELDGDQHAEQAEYDRARDDDIRQRGFRVLRFWDSEVLADLDAMLDTILAALEERNPNRSP